MSGFDGERSLVFFGLFLETQNPVVAVHIDYPKARHFIGVDLDRCQGDVRPGVIVPLQHQAHSSSCKCDPLTR